MTLHIEDRDRVVIVTVMGELDEKSGALVLDAVRTAVRRDPVTILLDLSRVTFCDLAGLRAVQGARRAADGSLDRRIITVGSNATRRMSALLELVATRRPCRTAEHHPAAA